MWHWLAARQRVLTALLLGGGVAALGGWLQSPDSSPGATLAGASFDAYYRWLDLAQPPPDDCPVVVYLDAASYVARGLDPTKSWPRTGHAELLQRLKQAGAKAVVFDIVFDVPGSDRAADEQLAAAIREHGRIVLAAGFSQSSQDTARAGAWATSTHLSLPAEPFLKAAAGWGLGNLGIDDDFTARRHFEGRRFDGEERPSLASATARVLELPARREPGTGAPRWFRYYGRPFRLPHISLHEVLESPEPMDELFRDRIVLVGARPLAGLMAERRDEFRSPFRSWREPDLFMPGVEVHATQVLNLVRQDWLTRLPASQERLLLLLPALLAAGLVWLRPPLAIVATVAAAGATIGAAAWAFQGPGVWFPWLIVAGVQLPVALVGAIASHSVEWYRMRLRLEAARRAAMERIREQAALLDKAHDAILVQDLDGAIGYANPSAGNYFGPAGAGSPGHEAPFAATDPSRLAAAREIMLSNGEWHGDLQHRTPAGQVVTLESRWTLIRDPAGQPRSLMSINTDVTEQRQLAAETLRLQRVEGIGALAGGIAHDLNNALAPVLMGTQLLRREVTDEDSRRLLGLMEASARRGADLVRQVLLFARGRDGEWQTLDLRALVREIERLARETFPRNIQVSAFVPPDLWPVAGNATQIHQILLNLCVNARDAMPGGGTLSLVADNVDLDAEAAREFPGAPVGPYVSLLISDTGTGIPPDVLPKIFDAFFTTKPEGVGTGLGLSTTLRIVRGHRGFVTVRSTPGSGTSFEVLLPRQDRADTTVKAAKSIPPPRGRGERILVIDDEQAVREILRRGLTDHGYEVVTAADGGDALQRLRESTSPVALLLCDVDLPDRRGPAVLELLRPKAPGLPVIWITGDAQRPGEPRESGEPALPADTLRKPVELPELLEAVDKKLRAGEGSPTRSSDANTPRDAVDQG